MRAAIALIALMIVASIFFAWSLYEPKYQGKTVRQWMSGLRADDLRVQTESQNFFQDSGAKLVPQLATYLKSTSYRLDTRLEAARALGYIGAPAKETLPALLKLANEDNTELGLQCLFASGKIPTSSDKLLPILLRRINDPNPHFRKRAAINLARLDSGFRDAIPPLMKATADPDASVREAAAASLKRLGVEYQKPVAIQSTITQSPP